MPRRIKKDNFEKHSRERQEKELDLLRIELGIRPENRKFSKEKRGKNKPRKGHG